jgi:hypothetical protein
MTLTPTVLFDARPYYASADLTSWANKVEFGCDWEDLDVTTFASGGAKERTGGLADSAVNLEGFWEALDLTRPDDVLFANGGNSTQPLTLCATSGAVGTLAYLTKTLECSYKAGGDVGKLMTFSVEWKGNQPVARGQIMHPNGTARTTTGTGTGIQLGAVTAAQRMYCNLHVLSISGTGTPTITVKLQSSVDNTFASPTDRIVFTAATALGGQASSALGAITDQWWRAQWTISGTNPSFLFAVSAGIAKK